MYLTGTAQILDGYAVQLAANFLGNNLAAGEDSNILQHSLAAVAKARSLDSQSLEGTAELVYNDGSQSLAVQILGNDYQLLAHLDNLLKDWQDFVDGGNLLVGNQDVWIIHNGFHLVGISYHVRGDVATVELHALYYGQAGLHALGLLNGDNAFLANLLHGISNVMADFLISGRNSGNLGNLGLAVYGLGYGLDFLYQGLYGSLDALLQYHRVGTGSYVPHALMNHSLCQKGCSSSTVTSNVVGLGSNLAHQLCAHVLKRILQLNIPGDGNAVIGNGRSTKLLVQNHVAALWTKSNLYCVCQCINALAQCTACFFIK